MSLRALAGGLLAATLLLFASSRATAAPEASSPCKAQNLRCEYLENPLGLDERSPRLFWQIEDPRPGARQSAYRVLVASRPELLAEGKTDLWDSAKIASDQCVHVPYAGPAPKSRQCYYWCVQVWDKDDHPSGYSDPAFFEMGLLEPSDWKAKWVSRPDQQSIELKENLDQVKWMWVADEDAKTSEQLKHARYFRRQFEVTSQSQVTSAVLYFVADSLCSIFLDGELLGRGDGTTIFYRVPVSPDLLTSGSHLLAVEAGNFDGGPAGVALALKAGYADGSSLCVASDESWIACKSPTPGWERLAWDTSTTATSQWAKAQVFCKLGEGVWGMPKWPEIGGPASLFRREFALDKPLRSARLYATALGSYQVTINGERVGRDVLSPDWTDYRKRLTYQTYDVTSLLRPGKNAIGVTLGDGWYASALGWRLERWLFGGGPQRLLLQMEVVFDDGTTMRLESGPSWKTAQAPILRSELYAGETYDARLEPRGWQQPGFDDSGWKSAEVTSAPEVKLCAQRWPAIRVTQTLRPKAVTNPAPGVYVFDMGQNMVGWARLKVRGQAGTRVQMRFAETLKSDGNIYRENLRMAEATDSYTLRGADEDEIFEPHFTYHGFRYVELTGYPGKPGLDAVQGQVFHTAVSPSGQFDCSSELVNHVWQNTLWGIRGNLQSVPTDCPQRDERLGWTGDAQAIWRTACLNFGMAAFSGKWMRDMCDAQSQDGGFPNVAPRVVSTRDGAPAWGDAGVILPWTAWRMYGDKRIVDENWDAMEKWMGYIREENPDFIWKKRRNSDYGDWVPADSTTPKDVIATAYWAQDARYMEEMAKATGREEKAREYAKLYESIRQAFQKRFVDSQGRVGNASQTCQVLALNMGLVEGDQRTSAATRLVEDITSRGMHLSTGFLGTIYLLPMLSETGHNDVALRLLLNEDYPSWGYMVKKGATTIWERWNTDTGDPKMNSHNHYCYGSVVEWLYRYLAGIDTAPDGAGFGKILIQPHPGKGIDRARAEHDSLYGKIISQWEIQGEEFHLSVRVPANTQATVHVPCVAGGKAQVKQGGELAKLVSEAPGVSVYSVPAGSYEFSAPYKK